MSTFSNFFCQMLKKQIIPCEGTHKLRFNLTDHTTAFLPQTYKLESPLNSPSFILGEKGVKGARLLVLITGFIRRLNDYAQTVRSVFGSIT